MKQFVVQFSSQDRQEKVVDLHQMLSLIDTDITKLTIVVDKQASVSLSGIQKLGKAINCSRITAIDFIVKDNATLHCTVDSSLFMLQSSIAVTISVHHSASCSFNFLFLGDIRQFDLAMLLQSPQAQATIRGACILDGSQEMKMSSLQKHTAPHCMSDVMVKCLVADAAQFRYTGLISVQETAIQTKAHLENKNMLLSADARAYTQPQLEVLTNAVQCTHGSAVGRYDNEQIFYLALRGLDEKKSKFLLLNAFLGNLFVGESAADLNEIVQQKMHELIVH